MCATISSNMTKQTQQPPPTTTQAKPHDGSYSDALDKVEFLPYKEFYPTAVVVDKTSTRKKNKKSKGKSEGEGYSYRFKGYKPHPRQLAKDPYAEAKAKASKEHRIRQNERVEQCVALYESCVKKSSDFSIGFQAKRLLRNGDVVNMPPHYRFIFKTAEEFIDDPTRIPALSDSTKVSGMNNRSARECLAQVLICLEANADFTSGRIGRATESGMETIPWSIIREDIALRFGKNMSLNTIRVQYGRLVDAGFLMTESIRIGVDGGKEVRSAAAYKQFTPEFFKELKVTRFPNVVEGIKRAYQRNVVSKGFSNKWIPFRKVAQKVHATFNASRLNKVAERFTEFLNLEFNFSPP